MDSQPDRQSDAPETQPTARAAVPRYHLPDEWSGKGACPVCRTPGRLSVQRQDIIPDRMLCGACGTAFEVETVGNRIRLAEPLPTLPAHALGLLDAWMTPAELLLLLERDTLASSGSPFEPIAAVMSAHSPAVSAAAWPPSAISPSAPASAPLNPTPAEAAPLVPAAEPVTEDWLAPLAAVIGGALPLDPPPDTVLADELERALLGHSDDSAGSSPAVLAPTAPAEPAGPARPPVTPSTPSDPKIADRALSAAIAARAAPSAPTPPNSQPPAATSPPADPLTNYPLPVVPTPAVISGPPPSRRELAERAWKLHELGNSLDSIRSTLESSGGSPADIRAIMNKLIALDQARRARFQSRLQWTLLGGLTVVFVLLALAIVVSSLASPAGPAPILAAGTPGPGTVAPSGAQPPATPTLVYNPIIAVINGLLPRGAKIANGASPTPAPNATGLGGSLPATPTVSPPNLATRLASSTGLPSWVATLVPKGLPAPD